MCAQHHFRLIMVTRREGFSPDMERAGVPERMPIYYAKAGEFKKDICPHERVDIWIDDEPGTIEPQRLLSPSPDDQL